MSKECISLHLGKAGINLGTELWDLYCLDHGIERDGTKSPSSGQDGNLHNFFYENSEGKHRPRAVFFDLEHHDVDKVRKGPQNQLFDEEMLYSCPDGSGYVFALAHYDRSLIHGHFVKERIRKLAEKCDSLQGFLFHHCMGGGTGGGMATILMEELPNEYGKKCNINFGVFPTPEYSSSMVEPYNAAFTTFSSMEYSNCFFLLDNQSAVDMCKNKLGIDRPEFTHMNKVMAQMIAATTASFRFDTGVNKNMAEMGSNLVPYPRMHFPTISYAPITTVDKAQENLSVSELTNACFDLESQIVHCNTTKGKSMGSCLLYRGDVLSQDVQSAVDDVRAAGKGRFVDWNPTDFKVGINNKAPTAPPDGDMASMSRNVCMLNNTTAVSQAFKRLYRKFDLMFSKKAFTHSYVKWFSSLEEFREAKADMVELLNDYQEATGPSFNPNKDNTAAKKRKEYHDIRHNHNWRMQRDFPEKFEKGGVFYDEFVKTYGPDAVPVGRRTY